MLPRSMPQDWPSGDYMCTCRDCGINYIGPKRSIFCNICSSSKQPESEIDYEAIRNSKTEMLKKFNEAKKLAEELGYVIVKKI